MFKLVVLSALLAVASSSIVAPLAYSAHYAAPAYSVPTATSYQSRTDVHSKPVVATYAAPVAPVAYAAPAVAYSAPAVAIPTAVSHQSRTDFVHKPVVAAYAAPAYGYAAPAYGYAAYSAPAYGYGHYGYAGYAGKLAAPYW